MDVEGFVRDGHVVIRRAFDADVAAACREVIWSVLESHGIDRADRGTWRAPKVDAACPPGGPFAAAASGAVLVGAIDALIGAGRWQAPIPAHGGTVKFPFEDWPGDTGWHIEGNRWGGEDYWTDARSTGRGLTAFFLFSDVGRNDAPTRLVSGSHLSVPPILAAAGPAGMSGGAVAERLRPSVLHRPVTHATGRAGDVYLLHPFLVHTATWPHTGTTPRMMSQPGIAVPDGFDLDGTDPSPVAEAIVRGLTPTRNR
ncbi:MULTISPECIES: phytanoyl-CoA dioxygenase family protein [Actinomadura]|uniref:Phytanoyl-CoA dioxygenase family protein n=1 Tax=Actinomadura yumaensis TaxID=111807 RepID=A0ABW2CWB7_9ACTN|nr:phytanoyl-CoA dioxygenase family protein [Actinomadura sp. J1-007]